MTARCRIYLSLLTVACLTTPHVFAQGSKASASADADKPITRTATIEAIDRSARLITLKGPEGNLETIYADQNVRRFDELKVGDKVTATYFESVVAQVRKPGEPAPAATTGGITHGTGPKPGAAAAVQETATITVQAIDRANQSVTVKRQDGGVVSFRVRDPKQLDNVKVGDTVDVTYTRAMLVMVEPAK